MKKWLISVVCAAMSLILLIGVLNYAVDPLMHYRKLSEDLSYVAVDYDYFNPGLAKVGDYSGVLVGTSLAENTDMDKYEEYFGERMAKFIYPGGTPLNYKRILDVAFGYHEIDRVLWTVDESLFVNSSDALSHDLPEYLYDDNLPNDVKYLLNLSVFYNYTFKNVVNSLIGRSTPPYCRGDVWGHSATYGKEAVLKVKSEEKRVPDCPDDLFIEDLDSNLNDIILPMLKEKADTEFIFVFPPKCVSYWYHALQNNVYDAKFYAIEHFIRAVLNFENARVFFFADNESWTLDFSMFKDDIHFRPEINDLMGLDISCGNNEMTADDYKSRLEDMSGTFRSFDYDRIMQR